MLPLSSFFLVLMTAFAFQVPQSDDAQELTRLLKEFLAGASRGDASVHDRFWADDLIYTGASGRRVGKADIMRDVRSEGGNQTPPLSRYSAEEIRIQQYGDTAIVAFRLVSVTPKDGRTAIQNYLNTGTFIKRDGVWKAVAWQATAIPATTPEAQKEAGESEAIQLIPARGKPGSLAN